MATLAMIVKMDLESISGLMETVTKEILAKIWEKDREKCFGTMAAHIRGNGKEACLMVKVIYNLTKLGIFKVKG